ncbi:MAG: glycosyltransferase family 4 protein [Gammaproteobacteria bacterium]|nr:glycosyltransferase family 4 protein [Gammaproteobacteria bacterium]
MNSHNPAAVATTPSPNGVLFVADRIMHYHVPTMRAVEARLAARGIRFIIASAHEAPGTTGRVAVRDRVVSEHLRFRLTEIPVRNFTFRYQHGLRDILSRVNPRVVMTMCHSGTLSEWLLLHWARSRGRARIAWQCGYEYNPGRLKFAVLRRFIPLFDFHLCYHSNAREYVHTFGAAPHQSLVMHNTIDETAIVPGDRQAARRSLIARWPQLEGKRIVLYVGAILEEKNLDRIFAALDLLRLMDVHFMVVGDGPYLPTLKQRHARREDWTSAGRVIDHVGEFFDAADLFVLPGTGGLAINEAMAHRLPVISGYADGSADDLVLDGETGYRLRGDSPQELADRLRDVLQNPQRAALMGAAGESRIRGPLSFESFVSRVVSTLEAQHAAAPSP